MIQDDSLLQYNQRELDSQEVRKPINRTQYEETHSMPSGCHNLSFSLCPIKASWPAEHSAWHNCSNAAAENQPAHCPLLQTLQDGEHVDIPWAWDFLRQNLAGAVFGWWLQGYTNEINPGSRILVADEEEQYAGRFELYPTQNMYNFILLDTETGRTWQAQWSTNYSNRGILEIEWQLDCIWWHPLGQNVVLDVINSINWQVFTPNCHTCAVGIYVVLNVNRLVKITIWIKTNI